MFSRTNGAQPRHVDVEAPVVAVNPNPTLRTRRPASVICGDATSSLSDSIHRTLSLSVALQVEPRSPVTKLSEDSQARSCWTATRAMSFAVLGGLHFDRLTVAGRWLSSGIDPAG
jgi:hypothetical protein